MNTLTRMSVAVAVLFAVTSAKAAVMETIESRVSLGTDAVDSQGFPGFFATGGFVQGSTSHTNTISFNDGVVQVDYDMTIEAFDAAGAPAGLNVLAHAAGINLGVTNDEIDPGEVIKVTYNSITFSVLGPHPQGSVDPSSFQALLGSIRLAAFDSGVDTFTYAGVGAGSVTGDDTQELDFVPSAPVNDGDTFTITGDSGAFRALYISNATTYKVVPEPTTLAFCVMGLGCVAALRRTR